MKINLPPCKRNPLRRTINICYSIGIVALFLFLPPSALCQSWYIKPSSEIPLRRGQGTDYKILAVLPDGAEVTLIEEVEPWAKVSTAEGTEGWVLKRYLTQDMPLHDLVESLQHENETAQAELNNLQKENSELNKQLQALQTELQENKSRLSETQNEYLMLKEDTANVLSIKEQLEQSQETNEILQQELHATSSRYDQLKSGQSIQWFLAGGGTLVFGCLVGMFFSRSKKRKSSLY